MTDTYRIDSHKLMYHVDRVNSWLKGEDVYPLYMEVATAGACNHRCTYCALDYMEYQHRFIERDVLLERLSEMGRLGIRSIMYAGEGEPLLHKDMAEIINHTKKSGIDVAVTSNGVCFTKKLADECLKSITWIKISINAGTRETYSKIHRTDPRDFDRVMKNVADAVELRRSAGLESTIGMQMVLLPENVAEAVLLARKARDVGADYLVIKPYSQHHMSRTREYENLRYSDYYHLGEELDSLSDKDFQVVFRARTMKKLDEGERSYERCQALPFWSYIDAGGGVWGCSAFLGDGRFSCGNIYENTFQEIWEGAKRKRVLEYVEKLDITECRRNCRMDEINRYLWELKHPSLHVNFI